MFQLQFMIQKPRPDFSTQSLDILRWFSPVQSLFKTGNASIWRIGNRGLIIDFQVLYSAIIVVDIQKPFYSGREDVPSAFPTYAQNVSQFLQSARAKNYFIVHAHQVSLEAYSRWLGTWYRKNGREWRHG